jgi:hypothetical protein
LSARRRAGTKITRRGPEICCVLAVGAHGLVAGEQSAQRVDGGVAELGGDGKQVVHAGCLVVLAALDVAADERRDREVLVGEPAAVGWVGMVAVDRRPCSRRSANR